MLRGVVVAMVDCLVEAQPTAVLGRQARHDHIELLAILLPPRLNVRLADLFGFVGEDLVRVPGRLGLRVLAARGPAPFTRRIMKNLPKCY
ncbi:hypothetical protein [Streptomyces tailanensis]|uniref:hypothetical protein n=1 Tax=Streptomyces tailanensis TaxID=2569858 RepID=UPI00155B2E4F|nr:hypothetical protein [Streptomyces tailanensis]